MFLNSLCRDLTLTTHELEFALAWSHGDGWNEEGITVQTKKLRKKSLVWF